MLNLRGKDYLQVAHRLVWFREEHPEWGIYTQVTIDPDNKRTVARAEIRNQDMKIMATAHKIEDVQGFPDHTEKAETGAIGRALALCGYGTQFAPELEEGERLADAPLPTKQLPKPIVTQPPAANASRFAGSTLGESLVPSGFNRGKKIRELSPAILSSEIAYWQDRARRDGVPLTVKYAAFVDECLAYLDSAPQASPVIAAAPAPIAGVNAFGDLPAFHADDVPF